MELELMHSRLRRVQGRHQLALVVLVEGPPHADASIKAILRAMQTDSRQTASCSV